MRSLLAIVFLLALFGASSPSRAESAPPVVVELFTSQGCPLCPPAEAFMQDLAKRDDVIALEFHIDYYDYSGWTDPFGRADYTRRWQDYARSLGARYEYTPLMVIDGMSHEIGSKRATVEARISERQAKTGGGPHLAMDMQGKNAVISITGDGPAGIYDVVVAVYDAQASTRITAGENKGRTAVNTNIVRGFRHVAQWAGDPIEVTVPLDAMTGTSGCAVLLQRAGGGPIIAAASVPLNG